MFCINAYMWTLEKCYWRTYIQGGNSDAHIENRFVDTLGKERVGQIEKEALKHIHYHV